MPALRQRDFVLRASFRVVGSCEPTFGPEDEGLGVDFAVVVEAVEGCAEQGSWREKVALDRAGNNYERWLCHKYYVNYMIMLSNMTMMNVS